jgi:hypothetical protein
MLQEWVAEVWGMTPSLRRRVWSVFVLSFASRGPEFDVYKISLKKQYVGGILRWNAVFFYGNFGKGAFV